MSQGAPRFVRAFTGPILPLVLFLPLALTGGGSLTASAQEPDPQASPVEFTDGAILTSWARTRLEEIASSGLGAEDDMGLRLERIRAMYFLSVEEKGWVDRTRDSLRAIRDEIPAGTTDQATYQAYRGALEVVRAKHARWPGNKLKHLNRGAEALDGLVSREPENLEARYLRLASYMFLPFFLRRDDSVRSDLDTLISELPDHPEAFSPPVYRAVIQFVLRNGEPDDAEKDRLLGALDTGALQELNDNQRVTSNG